MFKQAMETIYRLFGAHSYSDFDRAGFWTMLLTIITALLLVVGWVQLYGIKKVSKADFINKFTDKFFNDTSRFLMLLLDYDALIFKAKDIVYDDDKPSKSFPYFEINKKIVKQLFNEKEFLDLKEFYSGFDIDDNLLGNFEDIGGFEKRGLIGIEDVYNGFDWYIQKVWKNEEIQKYIEDQQTTEEDGDDIYENFKYIFDKSVSFEKSKNKNEWKWWWTLRWNISHFFSK